MSAANDNRPGRPRKDNRQRIEERITREQSGCWVWNGGLNKGSPVMEAWRDGRLATGASPRRVAWIEHVGPVPDGTLVFGTCETRGCVNPEHARLESHEDRKKLGLCVNGHKRNLDRPGCRECERDREQARTLKMKATVTQDRDGRLSNEYLTHNRKLRNKRVYGLDEHQFMGMLNAQGWACAICRCGLTADVSKPNTINIDHCHATEKVRGLLCTFCNAAIGFLRDSARSADAAAAYLRKATQHEGVPCMPMCDKEAPHEATSGETLEGCLDKESTSKCA